MFWVAACSNVNNRSEETVSGTPQTNQLRALSEVELRQYVEVFAEDEGQKGEAARKVLDAYPREKLLAGIEGVRSQTPQDPRFEIQSAFVLCSIGHDYENNKNRITAALRESRDDPRFDSVAAERMITRLIRRGDASLLSELFNTASWSDGALSEALSDTFGEQLVRNPKDFLLSLNVAGSARQNVLKLIGGSSLYQNEMNELKAYLTSAGVPFSLRPVAKELLANLRSK